MLKGLRILIADQHISIRTWMREQLSVIGATSITVASNASELMRMARTIEFDIIICDHHLDDKRDGQQLLEELRFEHILPLRSVFMIVTAERKHRNVVAAAEFAPDDYLVKPFTPHEISLRLDKALRKKKALKHVFDHLETCDHEGAILACDRAAKITPRYLLDSLRIKAESLVALGRIEEATALYESITRTKAVPWARMGYAMMLQRQKKFDHAKDEAQRLNQEHPEFISVYDMLSRMHEESGDFTEAVAYLERASAITSSNNTERLRKIADLAESAGDHGKAISTLQRVVQRTRHSSMLKVDDYLALTRSLLAEELVDEAAKVANDMREDTKNIRSGELASEVAASMVYRHQGELGKAKASLTKALDLLDEDKSLASDSIAIEIAEETVSHELAGRVTSIIARLSINSSLPDKLKTRLSSWFNAEDGNKSSDLEPLENTSDKRKKVVQEQIIHDMSESIKRLEDEWCATMASQAKEKLIDAFTLMPRDKRVINAHIRYNSIATRHGGERHAPTLRPHA